MNKIDEANSEEDYGYLFFVVEEGGKHVQIIVNCQGGFSRSCGVCTMCES